MCLPLCLFLVGSVFNNLLSPYLAEKRGIRYSFYFGIFLCLISGLSVISIVYVDKIFLEYQSELKKKKSKGDLLERLLDPIDEYGEDVDDGDDEREIDGERAGERRDGKPGNILQIENRDKYITVESYNLKIIDKDKRKENIGKRNSIHNDAEEGFEEIGEKGKKRDLNRSTVTLNTAFSYFEKGKLLFNDAVDEGSPIEGEKEVGTEEEINREENDGISDVEKEDKSKVEKTDEIERQQQEEYIQLGQEQQEKEKECQEKEEGMKEEEKDGTQMIQDESHVKSVSNLIDFENSIPTIESEILQNKHFGSNDFYPENSKNLRNTKNGTNRKEIPEKESLLRKEEIHEKAKLSDIFHFSRSFWILTFSSLFVYGKELILMTKIVITELSLYIISLELLYYFLSLRI